MPLWHDAQVPMALAWLNVLAGAQAAVEWQLSHVLVVARWVAFLPVAVVPLWQLEQLPVTLAWLKFAGVQAVVLWQSLHCAVVAMWVAVLPVAVVPL